jgi:hypothetical protein
MASEMAAPKQGPHSEPKNGSTKSEGAQCALTGLGSVMGPELDHVLKPKNGASSIHEKSMSPARTVIRTLEARATGSQP